MEWNDFAQWAFKFAMGGAFLHGVKELGSMRKSVDKLNIAVAVIVEKVQTHEKRITTLERKKK